MAPELATCTCVLPLQPRGSSPMGAGQDRPGPPETSSQSLVLGLLTVIFLVICAFLISARARRLEIVAPEVSGLHNKAWRQNCFLTPQQETAVNPFDPISGFEHERLLTDRRSVDARLLAS